MGNHLAVFAHSSMGVTEHMISRSTRKNVYKKYKFHCHYCNRKVYVRKGSYSQLSKELRYKFTHEGLEACIDHVLPIKRGGTDEVFNLVLACRRCNTSKKDKLPDEWMPWYE